MKRDREEIDPQLPYIQVHRGAGPKCAQLAPVLGVTYQHVRGSMDVFWEGLANRRLLAEALAMEKPMIVLDEASCRARLQLAFGQLVEPHLLVSAGFLEPIPGGYRVQGMSRYLATEAARLKMKVTPPHHLPGRKQPPPAAPERPPDGPIQTTDLAQAPPERHPTDAGAPPERDPTEVRGERREVRGDSFKPPPSPPPVSTAEAPAEKKPEEEGPDFWTWVLGERTAAGLTAEERPRALDEWLKAAEDEVGKARLGAAYLRYLADKDFAPKGWPIGVFMRPKVWRPRAHDAPEAARRDGVEVATSSRAGMEMLAPCTECGSHVRDLVITPAGGVCYACHAKQLQLQAARSPCVVPSAYHAGVPLPCPGAPEHEICAFHVMPWRQLQPPGEPSGDPVKFAAWLAEKHQVHLPNGVAGGAR